MADWAQTQFKLTAPPSQATMSRLLNSSKSLEVDGTVNNDRFRRLHLISAPRLEMTIFKRICAQNNAGHQISKGNGEVLIRTTFERDKHTPTIC